VEMSDLNRFFIPYDDFYGMNSSPDDGTIYAMNPLGYSRDLCLGGIHLAQ
jgi:hypothetical protein